MIFPARRRFCKLPSLAALVSLLAAGCAHYQSQPLSSARLTADFESRTLDNPELKVFLEKQLKRECAVWPLPGWDLTNLALASFFYHPDLDVARASWAVSHAGKRTAGERPNPSVALQPFYDATHSIPSPWLITASFDLPIETAGKRGYRLAEASHLSEAARLNVASVAWGIRSRVRQRLLDLYTAGESEALLKDQQALQTENLRLLDNQYQAGAISAFELTQARLAADSTRLALRDAESQQAEARVQLADAIGLPAKALEGVKISFAGLSDLPNEIPPAEARREALLSRADILGALAAYAAIEAALQLEIAKQYPDVHLNPGYEFDHGDSEWSLGATVTLPILNHNLGAIGEATARRAEAAAMFYALQARVIGEIERAIAVYRVALKKVADADSLRANLVRQEKSAQGMYDAGEISRADLTAVRLQLSASALARLDALTKSRQAYGQLEDAMQTPFGFTPALWQDPPRASTNRPAPAHP